MGKSTTHPTVKCLTCGMRLPPHTKSGHLDYCPKSTRYKKIKEEKLRAAILKHLRTR